MRCFLLALSESSNAFLSRSRTENLAYAALQHFIAPRANAGNCRKNLDVRHNAYALCRVAVGIENAEAAEHRLQSARQRNLRYIAVGSRRGAADHYGSRGGKPCCGIRPSFA